MNNKHDNKEHQAYVLKLETELHELSQREEAATRRMQLLVYPAMFAFIILSAYGFYLVSSLTKDVERMASFVHSMYQTVDNNMQIISKDTVIMSKHMGDLIENTKRMNANMSYLVSHTQHMATDVEQMSLYTGHMQQDLWSLNKNISKPLRLFNTFIPWSSNTSTRRFATTPPYNTLIYPHYQHAVKQTTAQQPISAIAASIKP